MVVSFNVYVKNKLIIIVFFSSVTEVVLKFKQTAYKLRLKILNLNIYYKHYLATPGTMGHINIVHSS